MDNLELCQEEAVVEEAAVEEAAAEEPVATLELQIGKNGFKVQAKIAVQAQTVNSVLCQKVVQEDLVAAAAEVLVVVLEVHSVIFQRIFKEWLECQDREEVNQEEDQEVALTHLAISQNLIKDRLEQAPAAPQVLVPGPKKVAPVHHQVTTLPLLPQTHGLLDQTVTQNKLLLLKLNSLNTNYTSYNIPLLLSC
jgi:hypothetical protein